MARVSAFALSAIVLQIACGGSEATDTGDLTPGATGAAPSAASTPAGTMHAAAAGSGAIATGTKVTPTTGAMTGAPAAATGGAAVTPATGAAPGTAAAPGAAAAAGAAMPGATATDPAGSKPAGAAAMGGLIPEDCRGFSIEGIKYSPGGDVLPNKCEPFHPTTNNPYAVRCTDVWPWYKTKFPGDNYCILPPPPDKGLQYGAHPQGAKYWDQVSAGDLSGYDNPSDDWTMEPGEEEEKNYTTNANNTGEKMYYRNAARMRPGSHHMIVTAIGASSDTEVWSAGAPGFLSGKNVPGAQRPDENNPKTPAKPPEDDGYFMRLPANTAIMFNFHHFNATSGTTLKEAWTNLWWESDARTEMMDILGLPIDQTATLNGIAPGQTADLHYSWNVAAPFRLVTVFGHRHVWTTVFAVWVEENGQNTIVYDSMDWFDEPTYRYDSLTMNPTPDMTKKADGGFSGPLNLKAGQKLHFNCHIEYTDERAAAEKAPMPKTIGNLKFANQAFTAEMCIMFGQTVGTMLLSPDDATGAIPDFAKVK